MKEAIDQIIYWYRDLYGDGFYLTLAMAAYVYLFVYYKESRKRFLYPIAMLVFCIINPVLYYKVYVKIIYWRLFWMIPDGIMIAWALTLLVRQCKKVWEKAAVLLFVGVVVLIKGTSVYQNGEFTPWQNAEKVATEVVDVCDVMLNIEKEPRCILPQTLYCEARQYSGDIQMMYGRNVNGFILWTPDEIKNMYYAMESETPDFDYILSHAQSLDYDFVVTYERNVISEEVLSQYQYAEVACVDGYRIYHAVGE